MSEKSLKVLLVDDDVGSRPEIHELLLKTDIVKLELEYISTNLAWRGFSRNYYDVCIIDSAGKGIGLLEESRRVGFAAPIIILTSDSAHEVLEAMRHGAADCLIRASLTAPALEESICAVINRARYKDSWSEYARCYLALVENSSEIIYTHDLQGNTTFINRAGEQLIGYSCEEALSMNFCQIFAPECLDFIWRIIERMLADRKQSNYEAVMMTKVGQRIPVSVTMHLIYKDGNPIGIQGIARDLSWRIPAANALTKSAQHQQGNF